jgi:peptidyl-tRNA hydrolase, PTH1 family
VDVSELQVGQTVLLGDIKLPDGVTVVGDKSIPVLSVAAPLTEAQEEAALETATGAPTNPRCSGKKKRERRTAKKWIRQEIAGCRGTARARATGGLAMQPPAIIAGLGNPGPEYAGTRHNAGFMVLECLVSRWGGVWEKAPKFRADLVPSRRSGRRVWLCRPWTYMNLSGAAVGALARYYQVPIEQVMVVVDDADLPLGTVRMRGEGGNSGHHGLESVEQALGGRGYGRQRIGIGRAVGGSWRHGGACAGTVHP